MKSLRRYRILRFALMGIVFSLSQSRISTAWSFGRPIGLKRKLNFESAFVST